MVKSIKIVKEGIERDSIWKIRKGLYPTLSSLRKSGLSIINEDFAIDSENLGPAISRLKKYLPNIIIEMESFLDMLKKEIYTL